MNTRPLLKRTFSITKIWDIQAGHGNRTTNRKVLQTLHPHKPIKCTGTFAAAVKEVDPSARVGGYASVGRDWMGYANSFLDLYKNDPEKPVLDFFSFHQYGKPSWEYVPQIENAFESRGLAVPDLYLTEWNNSYGQGYEEGNLGTSWRRIRYQYKCFVRS
jgi:hypothetical protein